MNMDDTDLKARLRLAQEKIARLQMEVEELLDMRDLLRELILTRPIKDDPKTKEWVDWSRNAVTLMKAKQRKDSAKKSPAVHRAEMARLWSAKTKPGPS